MLAATSSSSSSKMTGLDLATRPEREVKRSSVSDEMLTTPKVHDSGGNLLSPRFHTYSSSSLSSSASSKSSQHFSSANGAVSSKKNVGDDLLMTPVLTTPSTVDVWNAKKSPDVTADFLPENLSSTSVMSPVEPPKDLPMDSDIGLRSPCAGLLAKRRKMREMCKRTESFNSDSNSCDTPTSENSPHDLTTRKGLSALADLDNSRRTFHSSPRSNRVEQNSPTIRVRSFGNIDPASPRSIPSVLLASPSPDDRTASYKEFKKPINIQGSKESELPSHYTPSPLAVPSPNWSAVDRYFVKEMIKTPKNLDTPNVFDFLGFPPPGTPRSAKMYRDLSPNRILDYYPGGRDQHLSPRLSPRFPILDTPTDLSHRSAPPLVLVNDRSTTSGDNIEAEDLSTKSKQSHPPSPPLTPPHHNSNAFNRHSPPSVKLEYSSSPPITPTNPSAVLVPLVTVKTESSSGMGHSSSGLSGYNDDYDSQHLHQLHPSSSNLAQSSRSSTFPNAFYRSSAGLHPDYHRHQQLYSAQADLERSSSPPSRNATATPPSRMTSAYERSIYLTHSSWSGLGVGQNISSGGGLVTSGHNWTTPVKQEPSVTPPPPKYSKDVHMDGTGSSAQRKRNSRKSSNETTSESEVEKRSKKQKCSNKNSKGNKEQAGSNPDGSKRVYVCPHCQRSYDWNYNLNRHLKYECGKENAFQCAKCGRKFPHKQNCVYHLKRKHKVICDSIDQYMSAGLVIFKGSSHPTGLTEARPKSSMGT